MKSSAWKMPPHVIAGTVAALVIVASAFLNYVATNRTGSVDPRVTLDSANQPVATSLATDARQPQVVSVMDGEVARTADRIGEATALALSTSLYAATEQLKGRAPRSVRDLIAGLAAANVA